MVHAINADDRTHAHVQHSNRWGIDAPYPPPRPLHRHPRLSGAPCAAAGLQVPPPMSADPPVGLRDKERRTVGKGGGRLREIVSGLGGLHGRLRRRKGEACNACCVCSGKAAPGAQAANAGMCAGKKIAGGFDRVRTHHQKITARTRHAMSAGSVRAERALSEKL